MAHADRNFAASVRPYLVVDVPRIDIRGTHAVATVVDKNYGQSPAVDVKAYSAFVDAPHVEETFAAFPTSVAVGFANSGILPPTGSDYTTMFSPPIDRFAPQTILNTDLPYVVIGRVLYEDMHGSQYSSEYCFSRLASGAISKCTSHNITL